MNGKAGADGKGEVGHDKKQEWAAFESWVRGLGADEGGNGHTSPISAAGGHHASEDDQAE